MHHTFSTGSAYVFIKTKVGWKQTAELRDSGNSIFEAFGASVAISGTIALVGARGEGRFAGRAYVFMRRMARWKPAAELRGSETGPGSDFGIVALGYHR